MPDFSPPISVSGDVQGLPLGSQIVTAIQGRAVSGVAPAAEQDLQWDDASKQWRPTYPPGHQISYTEITTNVNVTGTATSAATTIITTPAITLDGTQTIVEFFTPVIITPSVSGSSFNIGLFESTSMIVQIASVITPAAANMRVPIFARYLYVPTVGSHTYTIRAWVTSTTGTPLVGAGTGTGGAFAPAYVAFLKS